MADGYKPDEFLSLDLSKAALSPNRLRPPSRFEPVPVEAKAAADIRMAPARAEKRHSIARVKPAVARAKLARRHTNPLDAPAFDTRIQVWPCRSGGICNWQRPAQEE
jgi:hypothetical protein